ncbi:hypothetical protein [Amycolatopsis sp. VC5-11]|uniref:hypothetical protein n=1 Tax=Amycolatopsis sp. VC5-11 TaxID=3120156 RepID=UPI0030085CF7
MSNHHERRRMAFGWMAFCTLLGLAVLAVAVGGQEWWQWQGIWPSILTNAGTAFLLAALLFVLERRFTGRVIQANRRAVREAAAEVEENLQHRTDDLAARIDDLQAQVDQRLNAEAESQDTVVAGLETPTYDTVREALTEANHLNALSGGTVTVQASPDPAGIRFAFCYGTYVEAGPAALPAGLRLEIEARVPRDPVNTGPGRLIIAEEWRPEDTFTDVASRMTAQLRRNGHWAGPETVDWSLTMRNLRRSLDLAIAARRGDPVPWRLHGPLFQLVGTRWAITEAGIEDERTNDVVLAPSDFPKKPFGPRSVTTSWHPNPPADADLVEWRSVVMLGQERFPLRQ